MKKVLFFTLLLGLTMFAMPTLAAEYYVHSTDGTDGGDCTEVSPCKTIPWTLSNKMAGGDTMYLAGTVNNLTLALGAGLSGSDGAPTTITQWTGQDDAIFIKETAGADIVAILGDYITLNDLTITLNSSTSNVDNHGVVAIGNNNTISNCLIYDVGRSAVLIIPGADNTVVENNTMYQTSQVSNRASIQNAGDNTTIQSNTIYDSEKDAIKILDNTTTNIYNNFIYGNAAPSINIEGSASDVNIYNNTVFKSVGNTILTVAPGYTGSEVDIQNNIFYIDTVGDSIYLTQSAVTGFVSDYNLFYTPNFIAPEMMNNNGTTYTFAEWQASGYDTNSLNVYPVLTSIVSGSEDLHSTDASPGLEMGAELTAVTDDLDSEVRPYGTGYDIGADERPVFGAAPSGLASDPGVKNTTLSWLMDSDYAVTGYTVNFGTAADLSDGVTTDVDSNAVGEYTGLLPAKKYRAQVQANFTSAANETYSSDYGDILTLGTKPLKVKQLSVIKKATTTKKIKLKWKKYRRVKKYTVKVMNAKGKKLKLVQVTKKTKFVNGKKKFVKKLVKGLKPGKKYIFQVRARKMVNEELLKGKFSKRKSKRTLAL